MSKIEDTFKELAKRGEKPFISFLMAGDPDFKTSRDLILEAACQGADIIEIGIPYAAPLADGPTIKKASRRSLEWGTNLEDIFKLVKEVRKESKVPLILMGYYNSIYNYGLEKFVRDCEEAGVEGVIIPDLPLGEDKKLRELSSETLDIILLLAPGSPEDRIKKTTSASQGFIYAVSRPGTTGAREEVSRKVAGVIKQAKKLTDTPVAVGFGISTPQHVAKTAQFADGVIVGSAVIKQIEDNLNLLPNRRKELINKVGRMIANFKQPLKRQ